ncbi:MAG: bifunctional diaminohydroxyphosphoribosylaminopyrimidine deaminase/5-amino-6-(5-phosphoribosylamino)uracil reductase RibD [Candidatus Gracilibacteria bacterium]|jgi:diaminohydroxyphosphoribosylaminopyrimidine deaminase/5-amino-6-(5-phosphoribosylamino)uracil reductase
MSNKFSKQDRLFMQRAFVLAEKARGRTFPNPMVGAVFVKNNKIIAEGYHKKAGRPHAEVEALSKLSPQQIKGGILYVTLEPCAHFGKTPPCTNYLINKGVKHVKIAMRDPFKLVNGKGMELLKKAGIKVEIGLLEQEARKLNEVFIHNVLHKSPFVISKMAITLDGKIATATGDSKWITGEESRKEVHRMRNWVDAIVTSAKTVLSDDSHLGVRMVKGKDPKRIIIDSRLETGLDAKVYRDQNVIVATNVAKGVKFEAFKQKGIEVLVYPGERIPLKNLLKDLYQKNIGKIMLEAGGGLFTAFLKERLIQKSYFFIAPRIIGGGIPFVNDLGINKMAKSIDLINLETKRFGPDVLIVGDIRYKGKF